MPFRRLLWCPRCWLGLILTCLGLSSVQAKVQFDVFPGYDNSARAGSWYPVLVEVFNEGAAFDAVVELSGGQFGNLVVKVPVELPTNTRKRFVVPMFCASQNFLAVDGRLLDARGKVQEERPGQRLNLVAWDVPLMAVLPGSFGGVASFPEATRTVRPEFAPRVARMQSETFPDNPIALEGLNSLYLNTARALELKEPQVEALRAWVLAGGQLIVAVDQPNDVSATAWLRDLLPAEIRGQTNRVVGPELHRWLSQTAWDPVFAFRIPRLDGDSDPGNGMFSQLTPDPALASAPIPLLQLRTASGVSGTLERTSDGTPWMAWGPRGRGQVVLLAMNPEREPLKSWTQRPWFWAKLAAVPTRLLVNEKQEFRMGRGVDGIFGSMVETRQIRKLPIGALLLLLLVYLAVIGPVDQWWLKKINRPMLTWITFPVYVVLFSGLIYFIGYKLRAGQTEWNELQVVDVMPGGDSSRAILRGRTFGGLYSPANDTYELVTRAPGAALRGEFRNLFGGSPDPGRLTATLGAQQLEAQAYVPVWTSSLNVTDWAEKQDSPIGVRSRGGNVFEVDNRTRKPLGPVWVIRADRVVRLESVGAGSQADADFSSPGTPLQELLDRKRDLFFGAVNQRENTFGSGERLFIDDWSEGAMAASFPSRLDNRQQDTFSYVWPPGFDLAPELARGNVVVLAWMAEDGVMPPANRFSATRSRRGALLRLSVPPNP